MAKPLSKDVDAVLPLSIPAQNKLAGHWIEQAEWGDRVSFQTGHTTIIGGAQPIRLAVEGDVAISYADGQPAGAIFTVRDVSRREQEDSIARHEERMQALGQLAGGVAADLTSLHTLLGNMGSELASLAAALPQS